MAPLVLLLVGFLTATCLAAPARRPAALHEKRTLDSARRTARLRADDVIPVRIGLKQQNLEHGYDHLMSVSDPSSPDYGKHWSSEQVVSMYAPSPQTVAAVKSWLVASGINASQISQTANRGWLAVDLPVREAEALLSAEYYEYESDVDGTVRIGCDEYSLPSHISQHVDFVKPAVTLSPPLSKQVVRPSPLLQQPMKRQEVTSYVQQQATISAPFPLTNSSALLNSTIAVNSTQSANATASVQTSCGDDGVTPACIRALYGMPNGSSGKVPRHNLGVYETGGAYAQADLDQYFAAFAPNVPAGTHPRLASVNGADAPAKQQDSQAESVLDLDILFALTYPQPVTLYQVANPGVSVTPSQAHKEITFLTPFLDAIDGAFCTSADVSSGLDCGTYNLSKVLSASYISPELGFGQPAQTRTCNEIMKLGLQGHTVLFASGDFGVAGIPKTSSGYNGCVSSQLHANGPESGAVFNPGFPGNCPYVLSVGGTQLSSKPTSNEPETAMNIAGSQNGFSSGGGFANYFPQPKYQQVQVDSYLQQHAPAYPSYVYNGHDVASGRSNIGSNGGLYNRAGRGFPDVSASAADFPSFIRGEQARYLGTSLSTPIWASIIALINTERAQIGKAPVGFVHPVLYQHSEVFTDITTGSNAGCGTQGFPAAPGWDPVTGLGTPKYRALLRLFLSLP